jgi:hypothetical protein
MPNIPSLEMQNPSAIPAFLALSPQKSPTRFHEDPYLFMIAECLQVDIHQAMLKKLIEVERRPNAVLPSAGGQAP